MRPTVIISYLLSAIIPACSINLLVNGPPFKKVVYHQEQITFDLKFQSDFQIICHQTIANISLEVKKQFEDPNHQCDNFVLYTDKLHLFYSIQIKEFQKLCTKSTFPVTDITMGIIKPTCSLEYPPINVVKQNLQLILKISHVNLMTLALLENLQHSV